MADHGKLYAGFDEMFPAEMARLVRQADYVLPNLTEAAFLTGETPDMEPDEKQVLRLVSKLHELGAKNVILTGVSFERNLLGSAISDGGKVVYDFNQRLARFSHGTGDVFASVFAGALMRGKSMFDAAVLAADIVCEAIKVTSDDHWYGVSFEKVIPQLADAFV
jgi:pyridoxine kinase